MNKEVTGCNDCMLCETQDSGRGYCIHPNKSGNPWIKEDKDGEKITPSDCPLFVEPLIISIKKD